MTTYLETERLRLRQFTPDDVDNLVELDSDPLVRRFLDMPDAPTYEDAQQTLARFMDWYTRGDMYGYWAAEEKETGAFIGWFHFRPHRPKPEEIEVGYRLKQAYWNRGYATEMSQALLRKGFEEANLPRIVAITLADNLASQRVMQKIGMTLEERYLYDARLPAVKFGINRADSATL